MGGKQTTNQNTTSNIDKTSTQQITGLEPFNSAFNTQFGNLQTLSSQVGAIPQSVTDLGNKFQGYLNNPYKIGPEYQFNQGLDSRIQNQISQGVQGINSKSTLQNSLLANRLSQGNGNNSALLAGLQAQNRFANAGTANGLLSAGSDAQLQLDLAKAGLSNQREQLGLAARGQNLNELGQAAGFEQLQKSFGDSKFNQALSLLQALQQQASLNRGVTTHESGTEDSSGKSTTKKSFF